MSVTSIPEKIKILLWGKAGGRCEYKGCNDCLYRDDLTQAEFNQSYIAHIIADSPDGPRGDKKLSEKLKADISNLMLMCDTHHRLIDKGDVAGHPIKLLREMKKEHEERMKRITGIKYNMHSHIIIYKANIGTHTPEMSYQSLSKYLLPKHYPAISRAIDLGLSNSPLRDKDDVFWNVELHNLEVQFNEQLRPLLRKGEINHMSVFAFAPMPLLIKLGTLIPLIYSVETFQPHKSPQTWKWQKTKSAINFSIIPPVKIADKIALNISLSAPIDEKRILKVLGNDISLWTLVVNNPNNDFLQDKVHLTEFKKIVRKLFKDILHVHGVGCTIHVFPAMPVSSAIEMGREWNAKVDPSMIIYDSNSINDDFKKAIEIKNQ